MSYDQIQTQEVITVYKVFDKLVELMKPEMTGGLSLNFFWLLA